MISKPSTPQLLRAVCAELTEKVAPAVQEPTVRVVLDMAVKILEGAAVRSANEVAWMREESDAIERVASDLIAALPAADPLAQALDTYRSNRTDSLYLDDVQGDYERAGEVLSCAIEAAYVEGDAGRIAAVRSLMDQRMANENNVIGDYAAVGRD